jgi:NAD(P)-dependent dehydrogenase (short-subunit alcohol dehydrogenase family)
MKPDRPQRVAVITGPNSGVGLETARQLSRRGFHVVIAARVEVQGQQAAEGIHAEGGKATFLPLDVSSSESIRSAAQRFAAIAECLNDALRLNLSSVKPRAWRSVKLDDEVLGFTRCFSAPITDFLPSGPAPVEWLK